MQCRSRRLRVDGFAEHLIQYSALKMAERANTLRSGLRQNASGLPMTAGSVPIGWRGLSPSRRPTREGSCPHAPRFAPPCVWLFPLVSDRIKFSAAICFTSASRRRMFGVGVERKTV